jgi:hypothetical protein
MKYAVPFTAAVVPFFFFVSANVINSSSGTDMGKQKTDALFNVVVLLNTTFRIEAWGTVLGLEGKNFGELPCSSS